MSWEAFDSGPEPFDDFDGMIRRGWEFTPDMEKARQKGDGEEDWRPTEEAIESYLEWLADADD